MCDGRACRLFLFLLRSIENRENRGQTERFLMTVWVAGLLT